MSSIVGIDIGARSIRAAEVAGATGTRPSLVRFAEIAIASSAVRSGEIHDAAAVTEALRQLWRVGKFASKQVVLGIGHQRVFAREFELPRITPQQMKQSLQFYVQDALPMPVTDAVLDYVPLNEGIGDNGPFISGLLVAAPKAGVLTLVEAARAAKLTPVGVDLNAFALARTAARATDLNGTVVIVDIGEATTSIVITHDGTPQFVRLVPMGGGDITSAIDARLEVGEKAAEAAKRAIGYTSMPASASAEQIAASESLNRVAGELATTIRNTVQFYLSSQDAGGAVSLLLSGGGSRLGGLERSLHEYMRVDVATLDVAASVAVAKTAGTIEATQWDSAAVAIGLALGAKR